MIILTFLSVLILLYVTWCVIISRGLKNLTCTRAFSQSAVFAGQETELVEVVRNDSPAIIPWLLIESRISPHIRLGRQENLHTGSNINFCSQFVLLSYQQIHRRHKVRFLHRGSYNLGNASFTAGDILGLYQKQKTQKLDVPVLVYPALVPEESLPMPMAQYLQDISRTPQLFQDPFLVRGIRAYQPGDPVRDIHWAASARTGETQVRLHDYSARTRLLVVLNGQLHDTQWHNHLSDEDAEQLEPGISLAATACVHALREGLSVGFAANMPLEDGSDGIMLPPSDRSGWEETLLTSFARLKVIRTQHFPVFLQNITVHSDTDILVLSLYDSDGIQEALGMLRQKGHRVMFQLLEGGRV